MDRKKRISRVDVQVSIVTAVIVITSFICVYFFNYYITHEDMINSLQAVSYTHLDVYKRQGITSPDTECTSNDTGNQNQKDTFNRCPAFFDQCINT